MDPHSSSISGRALPATRSLLDLWSRRTPPSLARGIPGTARVSNRKVPRKESGGVVDSLLFRGDPGSHRYRWSREEMARGGQSASAGKVLAGVGMGAFTPAWGIALVGLAWIRHAQ